MVVTTYNESPSKLHPFSDGIYLRPLLLFADEVFYLTPSSTFMNDYLKKEEWSEEYCIAMYKSLGLEKQTGVHVKKLEEYLDRIKYIKRQKHKNKEMIVLQQVIKRAFDGTKKVVAKWHEHYLGKSAVLELQPFIDREIYHALECYRICQPKDKEDMYIKALPHIMLEKPDYLVFDRIIEELMPFIAIDNGTLPEDAPKNKAEFMQTILFEFPPLHGLSYQQMDYTRENLKACFQPLIQQIEDLESFLKSLPFNEKSMEQIAVRFSEKIFPLLESVQKNINNELYIQQALQRHPQTSKIKVCLGITSLKGIIDYYEKTEIIKPYVADTIRRNMAREADITASGLFFYHRYIVDKENSKRNEAANK